VFPGGNTGGPSGSFWALDNYYFEGNDIDLFTSYEEFVLGTSIKKAGSPGGFGSTTSDRGNFQGSIFGCGAPFDPALVGVVSILSVTSDCIGSTPPGLAPPFGGIGSQMKLVVVDGLNGAVQKIHVPEPISGIVTAGYELSYGSASSDDPKQIFRSRGNSPGVSAALQLQPYLGAATASVTDLDSSVQTFTSRRWNGAASVDALWSLAATTKNPGGSSAGASRFYVSNAPNGAGIVDRPNFGFLEKSIFAIYHQVGGSTPRLHLGGSVVDGGIPDNNSKPEIRGHYRDDVYGRDPTLAGVVLSSGAEFRNPGTGNLWVQAQDTLIQSGDASFPTRLMIKPTAGQGTSNQHEWYDTSGALTSYVSPVGAVAIKPSGSQPACDAAHRFQYWSTAGGAGVKDKVEVCAKDATDTYAWRTIF